MSPVLIAIIAGLGGMLGWGLADFFAKKTIDQIGDIPSLMWAHVFGTLAFAGLALARAGMGIAPQWPDDPTVWMLLVLFGALQAAVYLFAYKAFSKGQVAVLNPIFASFSGITAIVSIVILGEVVGALIVPVLAIIFTGVILLSIDFRSLRLGSLASSTGGLGEIILATFLAAVWTLGWDRFVSGNDWVSFALCMYGFMTVVIFIVAKYWKVSLVVPRSKFSALQFLIYIGIAEMVAYAAISFGYSLTDKTSVIALISGAFSLPVIFLARIFLGEQPTFLQTLGSILVILGVVLLPLL